MEINQRAFESSSFMDSTGMASPSFSSYSSSDLDTESTGSFFYDKSITLGNLMGLKSDLGGCTTVIVNGQDLDQSDESGGAGRRRRQQTRARRSKSWWRLCRDSEELDCQRDRDAGPSLEHFLEEERRAMESGRDGGGYLDVVYDEFTPGRSLQHRNLLFSDGRILPPQTVVHHQREGYSQSEKDPSANVACVSLECFSGMSLKGGHSHDAPRSQSSVPRLSSLCSVFWGRRD